MTIPSDRAAAGYPPDRVDAVVWAFCQLLVEPMNDEGIFELYRRGAEAAAAAQQATTCSNRASAWLDGVVRAAEEEGMNHQVVSFRTTPKPQGSGRLYYKLPNNVLLATPVILSNAVVAKAVSELQGG